MTKLILSVDLDSDVFNILDNAALALTQEANQLRWGKKISEVRGDIRNSRGDIVGNYKMVMK